MAYVPIKPEELKKLVLMGKKRPMNMAYNPGPKDDDLLIIHKLKAPEVLGRIAKKEGEGPKVAFGTFEIVGKKLVMEATQVVPGLAKKLRKLLKRMDFSFKIEVHDMQGDLVDEAADEDTENPAPVQTGPVTKPNPLADADKDTTAQQKKLTERLRQLQTMSTSQGGALQKAAAAIVALIKAGSLDKADAGLSKIEARLAAADAEEQPPEQADGPTHDRKAMVARAQSVRSVIEGFDETQAKTVKPHLVVALTYLQSGKLDAAAAALDAAEAAVNTPPEPAPSSPPEAAQKWAATYEVLQAKVDAAVAAKQGDVPAIQRAFNYAVSQADAGQYDSARKAAITTVGFLQDAAQSPATAMTPKGLTAYTASRLTWIKTRAQMQAELVKLKLAIDQQVGTLAGFEQIAQNTGVLLEYIEELDDSLETVLEALVETPDGTAREALKSEAVKIIASYRDTLESDFFKAVDDNGFTETTIREPALDALMGVETSLAA